MDLGISHYMPVAHGTHREPLYVVVNRGRHGVRPAAARAVSGDER